MPASVAVASGATNFDVAYCKLPSIDIGGEVFNKQPDRLLALRDTQSGWADLGGPQWDRAIELLLSIPRKPQRSEKLKLTSSGLKKSEASQDREKGMETAVLSIQNARSFGLGGMIGASQELRHLWYLVQMVAQNRRAVLIQGETGTGRELLAKAIHDESLRCRGPFVKVNCAAIPAGLLESELFGHERGAFTGALNQAVGRFERAHTGTLFLDEIGDLPLELQPKLLRVLQEKEFERLGSSHTMHVNIRFVAATNQDLLRMVQEGRFRADLFYRLNVFPIAIPALRNRRADIAPLVHHFVESFATRLGKAVTNIPVEAMEMLHKHDWPGNIRELQNLIERAVIMSPGCDLRVPPMEKRLVAQPGFAINAGTLAEAERDHIVRILDEVGGTIGGPYGAASRLGIPRTTLIYKMRKLGIKQHRTKPRISSTSRNQCVEHATPAANL